MQGLTAITKPARRGWQGLLLAALALFPVLRHGAVTPAPLDTAVAASHDGQRARQLMAQYQCGSCHAIEGVAGANGRRGPALGRFGQRSYIAGTLPNQGDMLQRWIVDPPALLPGSTMPALGVSTADARIIANYLRGQP